MGKAKDEPKIKQEPKEEAPKKNAVKDEPQKEEEEKTVKGQRRRPPTAMQRGVREWHDILTGVVEAEISVVIDDMEDYMNSTRRYEINWLQTQEGAKEGRARAQEAPKAQEGRAKDVAKGGPRGEKGRTN